MPDRRDVLLGSAALALGSLSGCSGTADNAYGTTMTRLRAPLGPTPDLRDFVRYATLAPNGHNTQPWRFAATPTGVDIMPDLSRRTPVVDPDDHHLFVGLGCAAENLAIAASANGRPASIGFDPAGDGRIAIELGSGRPRDLALCRAIPARQSTRSLYDGRPVPVEDLRSLERAAAVPGVSLLLITDPPRRERVLETVLHANDLQMEDPAFMAELMRWLRFNEAAALRTGDGLYSACSGSRTAPTWLGKRMFPLFFTKTSETERYTA
ncbi:Acg family FMN-binding oxidoreductase [Sphingomonas arantia]|uniref:Acg family FMN-binding oxidoreductase n=1 Tax=Sphingomonas arantia TaxID=1460676 RepID=A0ABW4TW79_9SPHN